MGVVECWHLFSTGQRDRAFGRESLLRVACIQASALYTQSGTGKSDTHHSIHALRTLPCFIRLVGERVLIPYGSSQLSHMPTIYVTHPVVSFIDLADNVTLCIQPYDGELSRWYTMCMPLYDSGRGRPHGRPNWSKPVKLFCRCVCNHARVPRTGPWNNLRSMIV